MVEQVVRWETEDGQVFDTQEDATAHEWREHQNANKIMERFSRRY